MIFRYTHPDPGYGVPPAPPRHEYHKYANVCMYVCMRALTYLFAYVQLLALLLQCTYTHTRTHCHANTYVAT